jgi:hypothetical protein
LLKDPDGRKRCRLSSTKPVIKLIAMADLERWVWTIKENNQKKQTQLFLLSAMQKVLKSMLKLAQKNLPVMLK